MNRNRPTYTQPLGTPVVPLVAGQMILARIVGRSIARMAGHQDGPR